MSAEIRNGWVEGEIPGPGGRPFEVERFPRTDQSFVPLATDRPNLVLHTTEAPDLGERYRTWPYPPHFGVGDFRIVQLFPLHVQSKATRYSDAHAVQIEITGYSKIAEWRPARHAWDPLVALMAALHDLGAVRTALERPAPWPIEVDRLPAATAAYYRRHARLWPQVPGVYMHLELPGDEHWNAGGLAFDELFEDIRAVLGIGPGEEDDEMFQEWFAGVEAREAGERLRKRWPKARKDGWRWLNRLYGHIKQGDQVAEPMDETEVEDTEH